MHRIFVDGNDMIGADRFSLHLPTSQEDLAAIAAELHEGMVVLIYSPGEFELTATLRREEDTGDWVADAIWDTIVYAY